MDSLSGRLLGIQVYVEECVDVSLVCHRTGNSGTRLSICDPLLFRVQESDL